MTHNHGAAPQDHEAFVSPVDTVQGCSTQSGMAGPVFAAGTKFLNIEDMHFKHTFNLGGGGGYWPKVKQRSKSRVVLLQHCRT